MTASLSARGNASAALGYYAHLAHDSPAQGRDYYLNADAAPGRWMGHGAERLSLSGPVTESDFRAALTGHDPRGGARLVQKGGAARHHAAGWDMTFSAPKSVSVLWALSDEAARAPLEAAQQSAARAAARWLEDHAGWCRRGQGGARREPTAGLLIAQFDHETSRDRDPQLHTHSFIFNQAPRRDSTWGAIVSRDLYKAQRHADAIYQAHLGRELEKLGHKIQRHEKGFRVAIIPRHIERAFSKRQQAIDRALRDQGPVTAKQRELAALKTRNPKAPMDRESQFQAWRVEAKALGFELQRQPSPITSRAVMIPTPQAASEGAQPAAPSAKPASGIGQDAARLGRHLGHILKSLQAPAALPATGLSLRQKRPKKAALRTRETDPEQEPEK
ncbi:MobF family relaxase [Paremcibacter congregatus]|uniref:MobF family relaxase n=1 Tax=Paremcibacter congregatus TaxID=2043170 RepID=UPI0030EC3E43